MSKENGLCLDHSLSITQLNTGQSLEFRLVDLFSRHIAAPLIVFAFERPPQFDRQSVQDRALIWWRVAAAATCEDRRAPALRVGGLKKLAHEAEAGMADVGAAGEHIENGVDSTAEVSKGCDIWAGYLGSLDHWIIALKQTNHLEEGEGGGRLEKVRQKQISVPKKRSGQKNWGWWNYLLYNGSSSIFQHNVRFHSTNSITTTAEPTHHSAALLEEILTHYLIAHSIWAKFEG